MTNAPKWPQMIRAVYDSLDTGQHHNDAVARAVTDRIVSWLVAGKELSPRLQAKLIDNINMRTRFSVVDPGVPVRLTRNQLSYARRTCPDWFGLGLAGEDLAAESSMNWSGNVAETTRDAQTFQRAFSDLSAGFQQAFSDLSATGRPTGTRYDRQCRRKGRFWRVQPCTFQP